MIKINDQKVKEVMQEIHKAMLSKIKRGGEVREDILKESRIFSVMCKNFDMNPEECASAMNDKYDYDLTKGEVIQVFRSRKMANPNKRKELLQWAEKIAEYFSEAIEGKKESFDKFDKYCREPALKNTENEKHHRSQYRMAIIMIYEKYPEIDLFGDADNLHLLGDTLSKYFFYDIAEAISYVYGLTQYRDEKKKTQDNQSEKEMTYEQAIRRIKQLENSLERTNTMLQELQDEFDEQLQASKIKEMTAFFARLNSEKYGCILDVLLVVRKGVDELRKNNFELPIEINGLLIMIKKLIQFVRDSHIEPIMKINSTRKVIASDVEFCDYEGTPFKTPDEKKTVKVISPGWVYKDKELQISRPKVKEVN